MKTPKASNRPSLLTFAFMLVLIYSIAANPENAFAQRFSDINGNFAESEISMLFARGIVTGAGAKFFPARPVTRAEFAKMLVTTLGYGDDAREIQNYSGAFSDIDRHWAAGYITEAWELGIVKGEGGRFYPDRSINRAEMVTMLLRAFNVKEGNDGEKGQQVLEKFSDRVRIPVWAAPYVASAVEKGIVKGTPEGRFEPLRPAARAEAAKVLAAVAAKKGYIYDYYGLLTVAYDKPGEINITINGSPVTFRLSPDAEVYKGEEKTDIKDLNGSKVFVIVKNEKVKFIKHIEE